MRLKRDMTLINESNPISRTILKSLMKSFWSPKKDTHFVIISMSILCWTHVYDIKGIHPDLDASQITNRSAEVPCDVTSNAKSREGGVRQTIESRKEIRPNLLHEVFSRNCERYDGRRNANPHAIPLVHHESIPYLNLLSQLPESLTVAMYDYRILDSEWKSIIEMLDDPVKCSGR